MAITSSIGYGGTVQEDDIPQWQRSFGCKYGVVAAGDWKVTIKPGVDRTLIVAPGTGFGHTVIDLNDATEVTVQLGTLATPGASRWDMLVAHRDWAGAGGETTFDKVAGGASQLAAFASRAQTPGDTDDQPIALVEVIGGVGGGTLGQVRDLRVWAGNGGLYAADELALQYMDEVGTSILIGTTRYDRVIDGSSNPVWRASAGDSGWLPLPLSTGVTVSGGLTPQDRVLNGVGYLSGRAVTTGTSGAVGVLPAGCRPVRDIRAAAAMNASGQTTGVVLITAATGQIVTAIGVTVNLDGINFPVA